MYISLISYARSHQGRQNRAAESNSGLPSIFQNHKVELVYLLSNHFNPIKDRSGKLGSVHMKIAPILKAMGRIDAHSLRIKMMASYLHYLATNRCTKAFNFDEI